MIFRNGDAFVEHSSSPGFGRTHTARLGDEGGLTQFGASLQTLMPGAKASVRHWHEHVDEFLFVVDGEVTVTEDDGAHTLRRGDWACWPAGVANGHTVSNRSDAPCSYLVVGSRSGPQDAQYVPDADAPDAAPAGAPPKLDS